MSVLAMVSAVAGFVKVRYLLDKAVIDNLIFRTHYRITTAMFFVSCILVTANNLIGKLWGDFLVCSFIIQLVPIIIRNFFYRWSDQLHKWWYTRTCDKYILLDNLYLYNTRQNGQSGWDTCCTSRSWTTNT